MSAREIRVGTNRDITQDIISLGNIMQLTISSAEVTEIDFDYIPDTLTALRLIDVTLSNRSIKTLSSSKVSKYVYTMNQFGFQRIVLPSTSVYINRIDIYSAYNITVLDIPVCETLSVVCDRDVKLTSCNLGYTTAITSKNALLIKCDYVQSLNFKGQNNNTTNIVTGMPTLINVSSGMDIVIFDCPNIQYITIFYGRLDLDSVLNLNRAMLVGIKEFNEFARLSIMNARKIAIIENTVDLDINPETIEDLVIYKNNQSNINELIRKSKVLRKIKADDQELDMNVVKDWLKQGNKLKISTKNDYNGLFRDYPSTEFYGHEDSDELTRHNDNVLRKRKSLEDVLRGHLVNVETTETMYY